MVTTFPFVHTDDETYFGIVVWTRFIDPGGDKGQVEKLWLSPLSVEDRDDLAAFIDAQPDTHDLTDMEEEAILTAVCEDGLFLLSAGEGKQVWKTLADGTPVAHDDVLAQRGT